MPSPTIATVARKESPPRHDATFVHPDGTEQGHNARTTIMCIETQRPPISNDIASKPD